MSLTLNPASNAYSQPVVVNFTPSDDVDYYLVGSGNLAPAISEYIAYDQLTPPNPFLAVTQDGKGNVVYDGGFPKFYNSLAPDAGTPFTRLLGAHKFLYNALHYIAHVQKMADGNRKALVLGDASLTTNDPYSIKSLDTSGFYTTLTRLFAIAGFEPTFKDRSDYGDQLNPTLAELDQYVLVMLMSSTYEGQDYLTAAGETALVSYRSLGGGIFICTDHGRNVATIEDAWPNGPGTFFNTANKLARNFGAWFSGDYARSPVNAGFLRRTYGDHPLYNNIPDSDDIYAGGSESRVFVADYPKYDKDNPAPPYSINGSGAQYVRTISKMKDGSVKPEVFVYVIGDGEAPVVHISPSGQVISGTLVKEVYRHQVRMRINQIPDVEMMGYVRVGSLLIGEFHSNQGVSTYRWYHDPAERTNVAPEVGIMDDESAVLALQIPFNYNNTLKLEVEAPSSDLPRSMVRILNVYGKRIYPYLSGRALLRRLARQFGTYRLTSVFRQTLKLAGQIDQSVPSRFTVITTTPTMTLAQARAKYQGTDGLIVDSAHTRGEVPWTEISTDWYLYRVGFGTWELFAGVSPVDVFGVNSTLVSKDSGAEYFIDFSGLITRVK